MMATPPSLACGKGLTVSDACLDQPVKAVLYAMEVCDGRMEIPAQPSIEFIGEVTSGLLAAADRPPC
jgi:hypothetical protein